MRLSLSLVVFLCAILFGAPLSWSADPFPLRGPMVPGSTAQLRHGVACAPAKAPLAVKAGDLGREPAALEAVSIRRRPPLVFRQRLRLLGDDLLCLGRGWVDQCPDEFERPVALWPPRTGKVDHDLCAERPRVCRDRGAPPGYNRLEPAGRSLRTALAGLDSGAARL